MISGAGAGWKMALLLGLVASTMQQEEQWSGGGGGGWLGWRCAASGVESCLLGSPSSIRGWRIGGLGESLPWAVGDDILYGSIQRMRGSPRRNNDPGFESALGASPTSAAPSCCSSSAALAEISHMETGPLQANQGKQQQKWVQMRQLQKHH